MKKVLFIHHGTDAGGAPLSMLYTMKGVRNEGYNPVAGLIRPSAKLHRLYNDEGFETIEMPWIPTFITWSGSEGKQYNPITWIGVYLAWKNWGNGQKKLIEFINKNNINTVHLNSVSLSNCATVLQANNIPYIWHVREHGPKHQGLRYKFIRKRLLDARKVIFLSKAEQISWTGGSSHGTVIHNFIDFGKFNSEIDTSSTVKSLNIDTNKKSILYVGGVKSHKGIIPLLESLILIKEKYADEFYCLMPDSYIELSNTQDRLAKKVVKMIKDNSLHNICKLIPFNPNIVDLFSICDVLVFPATKPHFARPIIEASAMGKPVIGSNLAAIDELVIENKTGYLLPPNQPSILADTVVMLFNDEKLCEDIGEKGKKFAMENFEYQKQIKKIMRVYNKK